MFVTLISGGGARERERTRFNKVCGKSHPCFIIKKSKILITFLIDWRKIIQIFFKINRIWGNWTGREIIKGRKQSWWRGWFSGRSRRTSRPTHARNTLCIREHDRHYHKDVFHSLMDTNIAFTCSLISIVRDSICNLVRGRRRSGTRRRFSRPTSLILSWAGMSKVFSSESWVVNSYKLCWDD